ncbi:MAG: NAD(P)H-hydrate dehydratase [Desulfovermiculus sp.]|nr:NAD(P)H-hydrate dehydratase [Desulfovermiculus sp.]
MYLPLPTPEEMAGWDRLSIEEFGIPGTMLMENASRELLHVLHKEIGPLSGKRVVLFAGSGNNGGDAFALARHLVDHYATCLVLHTRELGSYTGDIAFHLALADKAGVAMSSLRDYNLDDLPLPDLIVDGLLGTGFTGELRQDYQNWISCINRLGQKAFVLAIDIPSGINGYTGEPCPMAVQADFTVTFAAAKVGLRMPEAKEFCGRLYIQGIGLPSRVQDDNPPSCYELNEDVFSLLPVSNHMAHKGSHGHVLILGGSSGLTGAPTLAALGALRAGAGLVTVGCPRGLISEVKQGWPDIMTKPLGPGSQWTEGCMADLADLQSFDAVVLGPGLGRTEGARDFLRAYIQSSPPPTVFDADALFALAQDKQSLQNLPLSSVLTPHPGEMARICQTSIDEIQARRMDMAKTWAEKLQCTLVLKGAGSMVAAPGESLRLCPEAWSHLAVGGSGDVLSGIIGTLLSQGLGTFPAACVGVFWHASTGRILQTKYPYRGNLAQDIAHTLPRVLEHFCKPS